jgi:hypothetical protein
MIFENFQHKLDLSSGFKSHKKVLGPQKQTETTCGQFHQHLMYTFCDIFVPKKYEAKMLLEKCCSI